MSAIPLPTKTAGERPPILPPVTTTFDGSPDGDDSWLTYLQDDVRVICRHADAAEASGLDIMIELLSRRRKLVESEMWALQATDSSPMSLPPIAGFSIDYLVEKPTREQRILQMLLVRLDECHARCERRLTRHRFEVRLFRDLGASDF